VRVQFTIELRVETCAGSACEIRDGSQTFYARSMTHRVQRTRTCRAFAFMRWWGATKPVCGQRQRKLADHVQVDRRRCHRCRSGRLSLLGVSRQTLYDILDEKQPVTPIMALRLGKLCGNGPELWLNLQKRYDLQRAEQELGAKIEAIPTLEVA
jgi:plasmid maintenance system antidote protein VapI